MNTDVITQKFNVDFDHSKGIVTNVYNIKMIGLDYVREIKNPSIYLKNALIYYCQNELNGIDLLEDHVGLTLIID